MTFIPSVISIIDSNNSTNTTVNAPPFEYQGTSTTINGYNYLIITISCDVSSTSGGIEIYMYNDGETPTIYYSDTYYANTNYSRNYKIVKKNYYIQFNASASFTINLSSRLTTSEMKDSINNSVATFDFSKEFLYDAFGKLRISHPHTLIDLKFPGFDNVNSSASTFSTNNQLICSNKSLTGTYTSSNPNGYLLISGTGDGHYISQSRKFNVYQPGKSLLILLSGIIMPTSLSEYISGFEGRIGYYSNDTEYSPGVYTLPYNGVYFSYDSTGCSINRANKGTVSTYLQSVWNLDTMDGNGPSKINLDFKTTQLFVIDVEWLGVGRIRFGFYAYGQIHYCHQILNINELFGPYMSSAMLPIRYELIGSGTSGASASMLQICSTVISEGGYQPFGRTFTASTGVSGGVSLTANNESPILAIRGGGNNYKHQNIIPINVELVNTLNAASTDVIVCRFRVYFDSDTSNAGATGWTDIDSNYSVTQYSTSFSGWATGDSTIFQKLLFSGKATISINDLSNIFTNQTFQLTSNIISVSDILVITCQNISGSGGTIYTGVSVSETY